SCHHRRHCFDYQTRLVPPGTTHRPQGGFARRVAREAAHLFPTPCATVVVRVPFRRQLSRASQLSPPSVFDFRHLADGPFGPETPTYQFAISPDLLRLL